jgi:hypothetical protein
MYYVTDNCLLLDNIPQRRLDGMQCMILDDKQSGSTGKFDRTIMGRAHCTRYGLFTLTQRKHHGSVYIKSTRAGTIVWQVFLFL